ncbi:MAG TPA: hypothetical protein VE996_07180 [Terriglobales bacterium]|jgi:hypothetical protein|nr:hypothetical protein [Terriglobales bacterium]
MTKDQISQAAAAMGRKGYRSRLARHGIQSIRATARQNGKLGGRPKGSRATQGGSR